MTTTSLRRWGVGRAVGAPCSAWPNSSMTEVFLACVLGASGGSAASGAPAAARQEQGSFGTEEPTSKAWGVRPGTGCAIWHPRRAFGERGMPGERSGTSWVCLEALLRSISRGDRSTGTGRGDSGSSSDEEVAATGPKPV